MKILILDENYPSAENVYGDVFVHVRAKEYQKKGHDVSILQFFKDTTDYVFEGVPVRSEMSTDSILQWCEKIEPDVVVIHFFHRNLRALVERLTVPCMIWVHGYEAIGWYRRLYNIDPRKLKLLRITIEQNTIQQLHFRKLVQLSERSEKISFVFPSKWLKKTVETDILRTIHRGRVLPNPIDIHVFPYTLKNALDAKKLLSIRPYTTKKYANDITAAFILLLSKKSYFKDLSFTLYGQGPLFEKITRPLRRFPNVSLVERFLPHSDVAKVHRDHGIFLCPTRQDAQGVSMCEAMSSGLVPLTSDNTAIPEFVQHGTTGMLSRNAEQMVRQYEMLLQDTTKFLEMSQAASKSIAEKCAINVITDQELELFQAAIQKNR